MVVQNTPEKGKELASNSIELKSLVVKQPEKLGSILETINLMAEISEKVTGNAGEQWSGSRSGASAQGDDTTQTSLRDQAIASLPSEISMQVQLTRQIKEEIKLLRKEVRKSAHRASKPGAAYKMNELYSRIRRLNSLLSEIFEASYDVIKRLFIRTFIDKQKVM